jgi:hypothetical protein
VVDEAKIQRLAQAFMFLIRSETYAVNRAALAISAEVAKDWDEASHPILREAAYSILTHSANLSKIFWPSAKGEEYAARSDLMRRLYQTTRDSPLYRRTVRNAFEHLDERLHNWFTQPRQAIVDQFISKDDPGPEFNDKYILRVFNVATGIVRVGSVEIGLRSLIEESDRLYFRGMELKAELDAIEQQKP